MKEKTPWYVWDTEGEVTENMVDALLERYIKKTTLAKILTPGLSQTAYSEDSKRPWKAINKFQNMKK